MAPLRGRIAAAALVTVLALTGTGCSSGDQVSSTAGPTATAEPSAGAALDPAQFAAALKRPGTTILDVRTPAEYASGHLPNAINIDVSAADFATRIAELDKSRPYAIYCRSGNRSAAAMSAMQQLGFGHVYHLGGGITAWTSAGGDTVS